MGIFRVNAPKMVLDSRIWSDQTARPSSSTRIVANKETKRVSRNIKERDLREERVQ